MLIEHLLDTMAPISTQGGWPKLVRDRLAAILEVFAANPDLVRFAIIAPIGAGGQVAARHQEALQQILDALVAAEPGESLEKRPSPIVEQAIMGGMVSLIARQVDEGATTPMQDLLPDLVELLLTPFVGRAEAARARSGGR